MLHISSYVMYCLAGRFHPPKGWRSACMGVHDLVFIIMRFNNVHNTNIETDNSTYPLEGLCDSFCLGVELTF